MQSTIVKRGFTLIELVVVISVLAILSGVLVPRVNSHMKAARDARRLADIKTIRNAVEQYYMDKGEFPAANANALFGGWDVSNDGDFISVLKEDGYLDDMPADPINDATYHYRYHVYEAGTYSCESPEPFYVLGIRNFESSDFAHKKKGYFRCSGRNWSTEFAYVVGGAGVPAE